MSGSSCLYECTVMHSRLLPAGHRFVYRVFLFLLDLDGLDDVSHNVPVFSAREPNLYRLHPDDYFRIGSGTIRGNLEAFLRSEGIAEKPARVRLLTLPRFLGYTFNPISIFFCEDAGGAPMPAVVQVGNTFGELKPFLVPPAPSGRGFHARVPKHFYVSPFSSLDLSFDFRFAAPGESLRILIDDYDGEEKTLVSSLTGTRVPLTLGNLLYLSAKYPLITFKIIFLIHWQALRLWLKGIPYHLKEARPHAQTGVFKSRD